MSLDKETSPAAAAETLKPAGPIRLTRFSIDNFKSLVDFRLDLAQFSCLIGLNGCGKSTVLQAVDFASQMFKGQVSNWLDQRQWKAADLNSKLVRKNNIGITVELLVDGRTLRWQGSFNRTLFRCTQEHVYIGDKLVFSVDEGHMSRALPAPHEKTKINFNYQGSVLSQLKDEFLPKTVRPVRTFLQQTASLDLLAPQYLRKRTDRSFGEIGLGGERLSAFLHELSAGQMVQLREQLKSCYPQLDRIFTQSLRAGWKELHIHERFADKWVNTEAKHINDGMLRLTAILAELLTDHQFLLFDEIENGINTELVERLLGFLVGGRQQILVTTHSPMILNYLDDEVARQGVQYLFKTPGGITRSIPFFSIPSVAAKLGVMGPGEVFVDTQLSQLPDEINAIQKSRESGHAAPR